MIADKNINAKGEKKPTTDIMEESENDNRVEERRLIEGLTNCVNGLAYHMMPKASKNIEEPHILKINHRCSSVGHEGSQPLQIFMKGADDVD